MLSINHLFSFVEMFENVTTGMKKKYKNETTTTSTYQRVFIFIIRVKAFIYFILFFSVFILFSNSFIPHCQPAETSLPLSPFFLFKNVRFS